MLTFLCWDGPIVIYNKRECLADISLSVTYSNSEYFEVRIYLNGAFYSSLPSSLQSAIKPTRVKSGHGNNSGDDNSTTIDNLYLLSGVDSYDTAASTTHQLEYYVGQETGKHNKVTTTYLRVIKKYNGSNTNYWLRSSYSNDNFHICSFESSGYLDYLVSSMYLGVAPAFRIG